MNPDYSAGMNSSKKVLVFFSNPYVFEDLLVDSIISLYTDFDVQLHIFIPMRDYSSRIVSLLEQFQTMGKIEVFESVPWGSLRKEAKFWSRRYRDLEEIGFDAVIVGSEFFLSDFLAMTASGASARKLLVHPVQTIPSAPGRRGQIYRLARMNLKRPLHVAAGYIKNLRYRLGTKKFFKKITGDMFGYRPARSFVGEGNADFYILSTQAYAELAGRKLKAKNCSVARFGSTTSGPETWSNSCLLIAPGDPGVWFRRSYLNALTLELSALIIHTGIMSITVRPHPRFQRFGSIIIRHLNNRLPIPILISKQPLYSDFKSNSLVCGPNSAAMDRASETERLKVVYLIDSTWALSQPDISTASNQGIYRWSNSVQGIGCLLRYIETPEGKAGDATTRAYGNFYEQLVDSLALNHEIEG